MSDVSANGRSTFVSRLARRIDKPIVIALACIVAL
jgi:ribose transport system permease protein